jgi:hypothetical protein
MNAVLGGHGNTRALNSRIISSIRLIVQGPKRKGEAEDLNEVQRFSHLIGSLTAGASGRLQMLSFTHFGMRLHIRSTYQHMPC